MADPAEKNPPSPTKEPKTTNTLDDIKGRISNELIIALCGAVGSGMRPLKSQLTKELERNGYQVIDIRVSSLIEKESRQLSDSNVEQLKPSPVNRHILELQKMGNELRRRQGSDYLAKLAIREISSKRATVIIPKSQGQINSDTEENKTRDKVAYIIDQLKHPKEVSLFKAVYPRNFYLLSLIRTEKERRLNLEEDGYSSQEIDEIIRKDRKQGEEHGQQVEKTVYLGDYFVRNKHSHAENLNKEIIRFLQLVHGVQGISPRKDERGMSAAYNASLQSACLSRQVGAAIADEKGVLLATGRNDVPEYGGGLYSFESGENDYRCIHKGKKCYNDLYKDGLRREIQQVLHKEGIQNAETLSARILSDTKAGALIEYSRAIHAEMDAITTLARKENCSTTGKILYCTTYPCHNCARHIVASGITRVVYIEPYEKSLALKLHDDSISDSSEDQKVSFEPYEGVSPRRYMTFFGMIMPRKDKAGSAVDIDMEKALHIDPQYLDSYHAYEDKIVENLTR